MATSIFSLFGEVFVDNEKAVKNIDETKKKGKDLGESLSGAFSTVGKVAAGLGAFAASAGTAIFELANNAASAADKIDKSSQALGMSREGYQEWEYILGQNGASIDSLSGAMKKLGTTLAGTNKKGVAAMNELGISMEGLNQEEAFSAAVAALQNITDEQEKARIANELFGGSYQQLMPLLNQTATSTEDLRNQAHELGLVMGDDAVNQGVALGDTLDNIKRVFEAIVVHLGSALMPVVQSAADLIMAFLPSIVALFDQLSPILLNLGEMLLPLLQDMAEKILPVLFELIGALLPFIGEIASEILPVVFDLISQLLPFAVQIVQMILPPLVSIIRSLTPLLTAVMKILGPILELALQLITPLLKLLDIILPPLVDIISKLGSYLADKLGGFIQGIVDKFNSFKETLEKVKEWIGGFGEKWTEVWSSVGTFFSNIWESIKEGLKAPLNWIIGKLNDFIDWVNKIKIPDWVPVVGGKGLNFKHIPLLAEGGNVTEPGSAVVGERGPEILNLPRGATVTPLEKAGTKIEININGANIVGPSDADWLGELLVGRLAEAGVFR